MEHLGPQKMDVILEARRLCTDGASGNGAVSLVSPKAASHSDREAVSASKL